MSEKMGTRRTPPDGGSWTEVRPGVWRIRVYAGERRHDTATIEGTEQNAWWKADQMLNAVAERRAESGTVAELLERWLAMKSHDLSPTTLRGYRSSIDVYLVPRLGRVRVEDLRGRDLDELYQSMLGGESRSGRHLNPATVRQVHAVIRGALAQAVKWEMVAANVALAASPPKLRRFELVPPNTEQISAALELALTDPELSMFLRLAATTGARRGELVGLRRSDFDVDRGVLVVSRAVIALSGQAPQLKSTKTGRVKRIAIDERTMGALLWFYAVQDQRAVRNRVTRAADPFLFAGTSDGAVPWRPNWATTQWSRLRDRTDGFIPATVRLHDLRHALATRMLAAGDDIRTVSGRLGHADPSTTLRIYAHFVPERDRVAADRIGAEF